MLKNNAIHSYNVYHFLDGKQTMAIIVRIVNFCHTGKDHEELVHGCFNELVRLVRHAYQNFREPLQYIDEDEDLRAWIEYHFSMIKIQRDLEGVDLNISAVNYLKELLRFENSPKWNDWH